MNSNQQDIKVKLRKLAEIAVLLIILLHRFKWYISVVSSII